MMQSEKAKYSNPCYQYFGQTLTPPYPKSRLPAGRGGI